MPYLLDAMSQTGRNTCSCAFALYRLSNGYIGPTVDVYYSGTTTTFYADIYGNLGTALNATGTTYLSIVTATGGYITKWYDQSGKGNHAIQAYTLAPTLNYTSKLADFTSYSRALMGLPIGTVPGGTAYTVIFKTGTISSYGQNGIFGGGNNTNSQALNFKFNGSTSYNNWWYADDFIPTYSGYTTGQVVTFKYDNAAGLGAVAGSTTTFYLNSLSQSSATNAARTPSPATWNYTQGVSQNGYYEFLGADIQSAGLNTGNPTLSGQLYYLLAFKSALSDTDRFTAETLNPYNKITTIPTNGPIDFLNIGAATNQINGPIDLQTLKTKYQTFGGGAVDLNTCFSLVNGFSPAWNMDAANYQSGTIWKDANMTNNYDMTVAATAYTSSWTDGRPTMQFDGSASGTKGAAKRVVGGALAQVPFTASGTTMVSFNAINNLVGTSTSYDWNWRTLYRSLIIGGTQDIQPYHAAIIEYGGQNSGSSRMGNYLGSFSSAGTDIVSGPLPIPYAYQQNNMLVHKLRNTSPYYEYQLNNIMTSYTITDANAALNANSGTACIGCWHQNSAAAAPADQYWGNVATVFMYNSILTNTQIQDLYTRFCPRFYGFDNPALGVLPFTSGLVGWYTGESWTGTQWTDLSGMGNHVTTYTGTINVGTFTNNTKKYLYGTAGNARMTWPTAILPSTYTLFHIAKYNGTTRGRIFDGVTYNWLSGFWGGNSGMAYHQGWLTTYTKTYHGTNWVISSDQNSLYRSQGYQRGTGGGTDSPFQTYAQLTINNGAGGSETSDWAVATVIVFNRTLTTTEMQTIEKWLNILYNVVAAPNLTPILVNPGTQSFTGGGSFTITQNVVGTGDITWVISPTTGVSFSANSDTSATVAVSAAVAISTQNYTVTATNPSGVTCTTIFSLTNTKSTTPILWPPNAIATSTFTSTQTNGTYTLSQSVAGSNGQGPALFTRDGGTSFWGDNMYSTNGTSTYTGTTTTTVSGSAVKGEWVQILLPVSINLTSYTLYARKLWSSRQPKGWTIAGSTNGTTWSLVDSRSNFGPFDNNGLQSTFTISTLTGPWNYFRFIMNGPAYSDAYNMSVGGWYLYGYQ